MQYKEYAEYFTYLDISEDEKDLIVEFIREIVEISINTEIRIASDEE